MAGYVGKILKIDLENEKISQEPLPSEWREKYIGGAGMGAYLLYNLVPPGTTPDSPKNVVIVATGPLNGTIIPSSGRLSVTTLSPVTGIFADSNAGGNFAPELKFAGYDLLIIGGIAKRPLYLWINDDEVELRDARHLWGKTTWEADDMIKQELGDWRIKTALVGPAAQKGILFGCLVINKYRAAGKTGTGSVLARKNLLGIAVRGRKGIAIHDPSAFETICDKITNDIKTSAGFLSYSARGTLGLADLYQETGRLIVKNRQETSLPEEIYKNISSDNFLKNYKVRDVACFNCPLRCSHWFEVKEGRYAGEKGEKPELVALVAGGTLLGNYDLGAICHYQNECNRYGIDMMECGNTLALAFEAYQRGLISTKDTDGIPLEWGNLDAIEKIFQKVADFEGFGRVLGLGVKRTAEAIGGDAPNFAIQVKGYGMSLVDVRNAPHWGLAFATASRGGDHLKSLPYIMVYQPEVLRELFAGHPPEGMFSLMEIEGKGIMVSWYENYMAVLDSLGLCKLEYKMGWVNPKDIALALSCATGISFDFTKLIEAGERICNVEKAFNARLGLRRKDDTLPIRMLTEPVKTGPRKGQHMGSILPGMLDEYYGARGWNKETSLPTRPKLESLGLGEIADELGKRGCLG